MESIYTKLALYGRKNKCCRTDNVYFTISEVCNGTVSLDLDKVVKLYNVYFSPLLQVEWYDRYHV